MACHPKSGRDGWPCGFHYEKRASDFSDRVFFATPKAMVRSKTKGFWIFRLLCDYWLLAIFCSIMALQLPCHDLQTFMDEETPPHKSCRLPLKRSFEAEKPLLWGGPCHLANGGHFAANLRRTLVWIWVRKLNHEVFEYSCDSRDHRCSLGISQMEKKDHCQLRQKR